MHRETPGASPETFTTGRGLPPAATAGAAGRLAGDRRASGPPRARRMAPLSPDDLTRLARRYLVLADAGLAGGRPHQAEGAVFALAGILDLLGSPAAADRARQSAGDKVAPSLLAELRAAVEAVATR